MATKLEELEVKSVDFVDRGANPDAHITLIKRADGSAASTGDTDGTSPAEATEQPAESGAPRKGVWKRFLEAIGKMAGVDQETIDEAAAGIEKSSGEEVSVPEAAEAATDPPEPAAGTADTTGIEKREKGEKEPMVDVSKMTPAERMVYEDIVKRYSVEGDKPADAGETVEKSQASGTEKPAESITEPEGVVKSAEAQNEVAADGGTEDIYKGLHPLVAAELKALRKRADDEDERALLDVAKKYEIIGKKPEELAPVLKSLKAAGGTAYDDMIGVLDAYVDSVNKSGIFSEIGKSGAYVTGAETGAWAKIEKKADEIQAANPNIGRHQAVDMACMQNPSLVHEYENGR